MHWKDFGNFPARNLISYFIIKYDGLERAALCNLEVGDVLSGKVAESTGVSTLPEVSLSLIAT